MTEKKSFAAAAKETLTPEEERALEDPTAPMPTETAEAVEEEHGDEDPPEPDADVDNGAPPAWAKIPKGFAFPKDGRQVFFFKFPVEHLALKTKGERQAILWPLSLADERQAMARTRGNSQRVASEYAMQMIRVIDGVVVDTTGRNPGYSREKFFDEIGGQYRTMLENVWSRQHNLTVEEQVDFFLHSVAIRSVVG